jgi:hypothetical protein
VKDEGAATDFVCWAENSHRPKREKGKEFLFLLSENISVKEII